MVVPTNLPSDNYPPYLICQRRHRILVDTFGFNGDRGLGVVMYVFVIALKRLKLENYEFPG